jgi:UDP-2,3-diacylglucosamine pyrophosphatase LpxH
VQERLFFISDLHAPYEDKRAVALTFDALEHFKPDVVVVMGDFVDCLAVSHFSKDPARVYGLEHEIRHAQKLLDRIEAKRKIYVAGNHEDRLQRYLMEKAPEVIPFVNIPKLLDLEAKGWEYVPYKDSTRIGKLHITHDVGSAGRYNVYKALDSFQANVVTGHTHRLAYIVEGDALGSSQVSVQFGWLGDFAQVDYMHRVTARRNWAHGFGTGIHDTVTGYVYLKAHPIVDYTCEVDGTIFIRRAKKRLRTIEARS